MGIREEVYYEGGPAPGDLIINLLLGLTVVGIPLAVGGIVRALWLRYRITSRRVSVTSGWMGGEQTDVIYSDIVKIVTVPRGFGSYGDMVLTMKNGSRLELRAIPKFRACMTTLTKNCPQQLKKQTRPKLNNRTASPSNQGKVSASIGKLITTNR